MKFSHRSFFLGICIIAFLNFLPTFGIVTAQDATETVEPTEPAAAATEAVAPLEWSYSGKGGPIHWGELSSDFASCASGQAQSPIDILDPTSQNLPDIQFSYQPSALTLMNNGHTVQVNYDPGSTITVDGSTYTLLQFHFHHPSEHTIDGVLYPIELHLVHADANGNLAVVAVMIQESVQDNPAFAAIFSNLPRSNKSKTVESATINANDMLPTNRAYETYSGSLTTPPCTEGVKWLVLTTPIALSPAQIGQFVQLFRLNARPIQPLNGRDVTADSGADS